jgi:RNA polymerase-binding transcription factor DksA
MTKRKELRKKLVDRRNQLHKRIREIRRDLQHIDKPLDKDLEEQSLEVVNDEVLDKLEPATRRELQQIMAALERMREGEYGTCVDCGESIAEGRLEAIPETQFCVRCAEKRED